MNTEWADGVLQKWITYAEACVGNGSNRSENLAMEQLQEMEYQAAAVVKHVLGHEAQPPLMTPYATMDGYSFTHGIRLARYALGKLRTEEETARNLAPEAPSMSADELHPIIWDAASKLWNDSHFGPAVQRAATMLNAHVQDLTGRHDVSDRDLMSQVFSISEPTEGKPRLRWPGADDNLTIKAMRAGVLPFSQGVYSAIRNPTTHSPEGVPRQTALEHLATLSTLARWVDKCEVVRIEDLSAS